MKRRNLIRNRSLRISRLGWRVMIRGSRIQRESKKMKKHYQSTKIESFYGKHHRICLKIIKARKTEKMKSQVWREKIDLKVFKS